MIDIDDAVRQGRELLASGKTVEDVLSAWRGDGLSILHSIQCLRRLTGGSIADAKQIVHFSSAWGDLRSEHDRFHRELDDLLVPKKKSE